jgi:histidine triad (HIT) family protein
MFLADGEAAMQEVFHVHLHVFPRYHNDGFGLIFGPHYETKPGRNEIETVAEQLRGALSAV